MAPVADGQTSQHARYLRAARRAFATVPFYREQWARAGRVLTEPRPTPAHALPDPPHTLCPFHRPWSPAREPSLWTPDLTGLARALRLAGCGGGIAVLEVRAAVLDQTRLPRSGQPRSGQPWSGRPWSGLGGRRPDYRVLLAPQAIVASPLRRRELNDAALAAVLTGGMLTGGMLTGGMVTGGMLTGGMLTGGMLTGGMLTGGAAWVVGHPDELAAMPEVSGEALRPVHRVPVSAVPDADRPDADLARADLAGADLAAADLAGTPVLLHDPVLGYLGALVPVCRRMHLDWRRVYARDRGAAVTFSLLRARRPTLLDVVPPGAEEITVARCPRHGTPVLRGRR